MTSYKVSGHLPAHPPPPSPGADFRTWRMTFPVNTVENQYLNIETVIYTLFLPALSARSQSLKESLLCYRQELITFQ